MVKKLINNWEFFFQKINQQIKQLNLNSKFSIIIGTKITFKEKNEKKTINKYDEKFSSVSDKF